MIAADVTQAPNDKQQLEPMLGKIADLPGELGNAEALLADHGYFSESNVNACAAAGIAPVIAMGREAHDPTLDERFAGSPPSPPKDPTPLEAMDHRLKTPEGKKLYALRKQTPEPVFGIIKSVLGFRQFLLRGLDCQIARNRDPHFAPNRDPFGLDRAPADGACGLLGAVGKWPAGATVESSGAGRPLIHSGGRGRGGGGVSFGS